jgi:class 3 adenylate cyclase
MFIDIVRSMELTRALGVERWGAVLDRFLAIAYEATEEFGGTVNQFHGDGLLAVFGAPLAYEDHARRACLSVLELRQRAGNLAEELVRSDGVELATRSGLSSGEVIVGSIGDPSLDFAPIGNIGGLGKRIESLAPEGSTVLSAATAALVEGEFELRAMGEFELKGMGESQCVFELLGSGVAGTRIEATDPSRLAPFVGRRAELGTLQAALDRAIAGEGSAIGVRGEPGVGKSRLVHEFACACRNRGLRVDTARAVAHGRALSLRPVLGLLRTMLEVDEAEEPANARQRIAATLLELDPAFEAELPLLLDFLGVADPERPLERIDPEARRRRLIAFIGRFARERSRRESVLIVIEDLHWIDPGSTPFVEELIGAAAGARTLIVATYRPEYRAAWIEGPGAEELALRPLDADSSIELLDELLGRDPSLVGLAESIHARTEGNPFFIEEVVQALAETGRLSGERGAFCLSGSVAEVVLPATVQAVLGARIDRLAVRDKLLLQTMAVIGKRVDRRVLREVAELEPAELAEAASALLAAEFVTEQGDGEGYALAFKHPLTQEVAYASQLSEPRARLHAAVADAIERGYPDGLDERAALLAHHSEAAGLPLRAAGWHARAAAWVWVSAPEEGMRHWQRVRELAAEAAGTPEADQLGILARISILSLAWRVAMPLEEVEPLYAEGRDLLGGKVTGASRPEEMLLDIAYAANLFFAGRELEGLEFSTQSTRVAAEIGDPGLVLNAHVYAAVGALTIGALRESFELADRALELAGEDCGAGAGVVTGNPYAHCLWARGFSRLLMGSFGPGFRDFERSLEIAGAFGDSLCQQSVLNCRAISRGLNFEPERGLIDAEGAAELADGIGDDQARIASRVTLSHLRNECGDFEGGRAAAELGLTLLRERRSALTWEADLLAVLAASRLGLGELGPARAAAEESLVISERRSLMRTVALGRFTLGRVLLHSSVATEETEEAFERAQAAAHAIEFRALEPWVRMELLACAHSGAGERSG